MTKKLPPEVKHSRRSIDIACEFCHKKHIQCDKGRPCQSCIRRNISDSCRDTPRKVKRRRYSSSNSALKQKDIKPQITGDQLDVNNNPYMNPGYISTNSNTSFVSLSGSFNNNNMNQNLIDMAVNDFTSPSNRSIQSPTKVDDSDISGSSLGQLSRNFSPDPDFSSNWTNEEYMKLKDILKGEEGTKSVPFMSPIDLHSKDFDFNMCTDNNSIKNITMNANNTGNYDQTLGRKESVFNLAQYLDSGKQTLQKPDARAYISLDNALTTHIQQPQQQNDSQIPEKKDTELTPWELRELIGTPEELYKNQHIIKAHNYHYAYSQLKNVLNAKFQGYEDPQIVHKLVSYLFQFYIPKFISLTTALIKEDVVFQEIILQRTLLDVESMVKLASCTPVAIWRRSGEVCFVSSEFTSLTGFSSKEILSKRTFIFEFWDRETTINYFQHFPQYLAFGDRNSASNSSSTGTNTNMDYSQCNLLLQNGIYLRCAVCWTVKRDNFNIPLLIIGQFLPIFNSN